MFFILLWARYLDESCGARKYFKMKVKASLKLICPDCYFVRRGKKLYLRCKSQPRHKRRQGFSTINYRPPMEWEYHTTESPTPIEGFSLNSLPIENHEDHQEHVCCGCCKPMVA